MKIFYQTPKAVSTGGRSGRVELEDGSLGFDLVPFSDTEKTGANPENCSPWATPPVLTTC